MVRDLLGVGQQAVSLVPPGVAERGDDLGPRGPAITLVGRIVGAGEERFQRVRVDERVERPATRAGERLTGRHVERIDVRALLAVDLDADKSLVHHRGRRLVSERLVFHHVAPVTGCVSDGHQQWPVEGAGEFDGVIIPRLPGHRVRGVLQQVGGGAVRKSVRRPFVSHFSALSQPSRHHSPCASSTSMGMIASASSCVHSREIGQATPSSVASIHVCAQTHQRSPGTRPGKLCWGAGVMRSFPCERANSRKSSVKMQQTTWRPRSWLSVLQQPSRCQPVSGSIEQGSSSVPRTLMLGCMGSAGQPMDINNDIGRRL